MTLNEVYQRLREEGKEIGQAARDGNEKAKRVIEMYQLLYTCPGDPVAQTLLVAAYEEYSVDQRDRYDGCTR